MKKFPFFLKKHSPIFQKGKFIYTVLSFWKLNQLLTVFLQLLRGQVWLKKKFKEDIACHKKGTFRVGSIADENPTIRCASLIYNNVLHERHFCLNSWCRVAPKPKGLISHGVLQQDLTSQQGRCLRLPVLHTKTFAGFCQQTQSMRMFFCSPSRLKWQVVTPLAAMEQAIYSVSRLTVCRPTYLSWEGNMSVTKLC